MGAPRRQPELVRPAEAAAILGVTRQHLAKYAKDWGLHPVRTPGGHRRYWLVEVRNLSAESQEASRDRR